MSFRIARIVLLSSLACFACLSTAPSAFAESQWIEIQSPHFSVATDVGEKRGKEVALRFEQMRSVFGALMTKANVNLPIPLQIVAFRNSKELRQVVPLWHGKPVQVTGLFQPGQDRCFIMLDMSVDNPWRVVFHEYAHELMNGSLSAEVDPWFEEGFAEYFSSIDIDGKQARVGTIPEDEYEVLRQQDMMKVVDLFKVQHNSGTYNENGDHRTIFYAESGMLVHFLYEHGLVLKLGTYFALKINKGLPIEDAIQQSFGMSADQFDKTFRSYARSGQYKYFIVPTPADTVGKGYSVRPLGPYESSAVIADIHLHSPGYHDKALGEFQDILKQDPHNAAAARGLGYAYLQARDFKQAGEYFKRAAIENSNDARVHYYSALLMNANWSDNSNAADIARELETAISLNPSFADAYMLLGYASMRAGDIPKGLANMKKAVSLSPRNEEYRFNLAQMYLTNRQPDEGIEILEVLSNSSDPMVAQRAQESLGQAQQFKAAIDAAVAGAGPQSRKALAVSDAALTGDAQGHKAVDTQNSVVTPPDGQIRFLKGRIRNVDCASPPVARLVVDSGNKSWVLNVADIKHALVLGAGAFSCDWKKQNVAVNFRETGPATGTVVSIEVQ